MSIDGCIAFHVGGALVGLSDSLRCKCVLVALFVLETPKTTNTYSVPHIRITTRIFSHVEITLFVWDSSSRFVVKIKKPQSILSNPKKNQCLANDIRKIIGRQKYHKEPETAKIDKGLVAARQGKKRRSRKHCLVLTCDPTGSLGDDSEADCLA